MLDVERGGTRAGAEGCFELRLADRTIHLDVPRYRMPALPKLSAGYFAAPDMDLIDLFIGSEGTLGVVTAVTLRVLPERPAQCLALVPFADRREALAFVRRLRDEAIATRRGRDPLRRRRLGYRAHGRTLPRADPGRRAGPRQGVTLPPRPPSRSWSHSSFQPA